MDDTGGMSTTFTERVRRQLRDEVLDAASAAVFTGGWQALRMQTIADDVGISRRTLYNEFGSKTLLAEALVLHVTKRFLDDVRVVMLAGTDLRESWEAAVLATLRASDTDPVLSTVLTAASEEFLPLLTSQGSQVISYATARLVAAVGQRWPELPHRETALAAEAAVRLTLSQIVRPGPDIETAARDIAELTTGYLRQSATP
jgi:AcrR family transcriptional regulator